MSNNLLIITFIILGGIFIFIAARLSRKHYNKKNSIEGNRFNKRLFIVFFINLLFLITLVYFYPFGSYIVMGAYILLIMHIPNEKPSLYKDIIYTGLICTLIAGSLSYLRYIAQ